MNSGFQNPLEIYKILRCINWSFIDVLTRLVLDYACSEMILTIKVPTGPRGTCPYHYFSYLVRSTNSYSDAIRTYEVLHFMSHCADENLDEVHCNTVQPKVFKLVLGPTETTSFYFCTSPIESLTGTWYYTAEHRLLNVWSLIKPILGEIQGCPTSVVNDILKCIVMKDGKLVDCLYHALPVQ